MKPFFTITIMTSVILFVDTLEVDNLIKLFGCVLIDGGVMIFYVLTTPKILDKFFHMED